MRCNIIKFFVVAGALLAAAAGSLVAQDVLPGYDLLTTQPGTSYMGVAFEGVPLGTYNFGG